MTIEEAISACEAEFPGCRWSIARPSEMFTGKPSKFRKENPFEAWLVHGNFGTKEFICEPGDGVTPVAALIAATAAAVAIRESKKQAQK